MQIIRQNIKYMLQLFEVGEASAFIFSTPNKYNRSKNIFTYSFAYMNNVKNYWTEIFGATYVNINQANVQIFFKSFLTQVESIQRLMTEINSFFVDFVAEKFYININLYWWRRISGLSYIYTSDTGIYTSAPKDHSNNSDNSYISGATTQNAKVIFKIPSLNQALPNIISGFSLYNDYSVQLDNTNGYWDNASITRFFNTPAIISKSIKKSVSKINDFNIIRKGVVKNIDVNLEEARLTIADNSYSFSTSFCKTFYEYKNIMNITEDILDQDIPAGFGFLRNVPLIEINDNDEYVALDKDFISEVTAVYDKDLNSITFTYNHANGVIKSTQLDDKNNIIQPDMCDIECSGSAKIADIIKYVLVNNESISFIEENFDIDEWQAYTDYCSEIALFIESKTTNEIINDCLKNDNAYLIQKNDGRLTLRLFGHKYNTFIIPEWTITSIADKSYADASNNYCSSVQINYDYNVDKDTTTKAYINDSLEDSRIKQYKKSAKAIFETKLMTVNAAEKLSNILLHRFGYLKETVKLSLGVDTFNINLLDLISIKVKSNNRIFSNSKVWIVLRIRIRAASLSPMATESSTSKIIVSAPKTGAFIIMAGLFPGINSKDLRTAIMHSPLMPG